MRAGVPDFFIVGNPKSGTTALYEMLRQHPGIYMPDLKETRFFAGELHPDDGTSSLPRSLAEYSALFEAARGDQIAGEASPSYLRSERAAGRIAAHRPDARIIAIFREPASFVRSMHLELLKDQVEREKDLRTALDQEDERRRNRARRPGLLYSDYVRYVEQLERFHAVFPADQVLVLVYEDFRRDNTGTLREVFRFLGVDDSVAVGPLEANPTVRVRSVRAQGLLRTLYLGEGRAAHATKGLVKALTPERLRREGLQAVRNRLVHAEPEPPDEELMLELRRRFRPEVVALGEYLHRDLVTFWGYDRLA